MGGRRMDGLNDRPHYAIHGSLLVLALFSCTGFPEVTWMSITQILIFYYNFRHPQPQTTTPSHPTYDSTTSSRVKTCRRRIATRINGKIHARIEASKQFWMAIPNPYYDALAVVVLSTQFSFFLRNFVMNLSEIRMLGRGLGLGTRDQPL